MEELFAVIDTETTYYNQVMSIGIVISRFPDYEIIDKLYYIITPTFMDGGMFTYQIDNTRGVESSIMTRKEVINDIKNKFNKYNLKNIFAYNANFDYGHLPELSSYNWYDIMRIAAYKQYNDKLPSYLEYCNTGRLKRNYGVETIYSLLSNCDYNEIHNAICDAIDELEIMKMLNKDFEIYNISIINREKK